METCWIGHHLVLVSVAVGVMEHHDHKLRERFDCFILHVSIEGNEDMNSDRPEPVEGAAYWLPPLACWACFHVEPRTTISGVAPPTMYQALPHQSLIKEMPYSWTLWRHFLNGVSSFQISSLCQVNRHETHQRTSDAGNTGALGSLLLEVNL